MSKIELQFQRCYLDGLKIVMNHSMQEDLLFTFGKGLKKIASDLGGDIKVNQGADAMPSEAPRVTIRAKEIYISFGLSRIEVGIKGSRKHVRSDDLLTVYKRQLKEVELLILAYLQDTGIKENFIGIIAPVRFPQEIHLPKELIVKTLYDIFVGRGNPSLAAFSFKIGMVSDGFYENYEVSDYEVKNVTVNPSSASLSLINPDEYPTVEKGLRILVDVNNKTQLNHNFSTDYANVSNYFFDAVKTLKRIFNNE